MANTHISQKSFRYRNGTDSGNYQVLTTSQNQNTLRGFDISNMSPTQVNTLREKWNGIKTRNWTLTEKESWMLKNYRPAKGSFKTFKMGKIRYFHKGN